MARIASKTDRGIRRPTNQDAHCLKVAHTSRGQVALVAVCDGVGGLNSGELASSTMVRHLSDWFTGILPGIVSAGRPGEVFDPADAMDSLLELVAHANDGIGIYGDGRGEMLGTTLTAVLCCAGRYLAVHVGDTRAYLVGEHGATQITQDQTLARHNMMEGRLPADQVEGGPGSSVLMQAIGTQVGIEPSCYAGHYEPNDLFVVCCDGAWHNQGKGGIERLFGPLRSAREGDLAGACAELVSDDIAQGETDNVTVAVLGPDDAPRLGGGEDPGPVCLRDGDDVLGSTGSLPAVGEMGHGTSQ